jgi:flagellin
MIIQTNLLTLDANRNLRKLSSAAQIRSEKLSSGFRINSAKDDAAGLALSEKMRAQMRGIDWAGKNAQNAQALIQTAEGGLNEIDNMVQRMRELVVYAANDTNDQKDSEKSQGDRQKIQDEIAQLAKEIDDISKRVEYNKKKVLSGEIANVHVLAAGIKTQIKLNDKTFDSFIADMKDDTDILKDVTPPPPDIDEILKITLQGGQLHLDDYEKLSVIEDAFREWESALAGGEVLLSPEQANAFNDFKAKLSGAAELSRYNRFLRDQLLTIPGGVTEDEYRDIIRTRNNYEWDRANFAVSNALSRLNVMTQGPTIAGLGPDTLLQQMIVAEPALGFDTEGVWQGFVVSNDANGNPATVGHWTLENLLVRTADDGGPGGQQNADTQAEIDTVLQAIVDWKTACETQGITLSAEEAAAWQAVYDNWGLAGRAARENALLDQNPVDPAAEASDGRYGEGLWFQLGPNAGQGMEISINKVDTSTLCLGNGGGQTEIDVREESGLHITEMLKTLDRALTIVTKERSRLGAAHERLEYTIRSLGVTNENLAAAESRVRDADMAKEMSELAKANVLQESTAAMAAQGNRAAQNVTQVLK